MSAGPQASAVHEKSDYPREQTRIGKSPPLQNFRLQRPIACHPIAMGDSPAFRRYLAALNAEYDRVVTENIELRKELQKERFGMGCGVH